MICLKSKVLAINGNITNLTIGESAFSNTKLKSFTVPKSVEQLNIGYEAFSPYVDVEETDNFASEKGALETFEILGNVNKLNIEERAFSNTNLKSFTVPKSMENQLNSFANAFSNENLEFITLSQET